MKYDVCVFGTCSIDQTFYQNIDGSYNDIPDTISPGGKGSNQAVASSKAGAKTTIITRLGKDGIGYQILDNLNMMNVNTSNVELINGLENDYSNLYVNIPNKDYNIKRYTNSTNSFTINMIKDYKHVLLGSKIILCQLKIPKEVSINLINFCYENNKILILTPCHPDKLSIVNQENIDLIDKISIIMCNKEEYEIMFNTDDIFEYTKKYPNKLIVTLGDEGLIYFNGDRFINMPAIETNVIDTTGAGDTLCGNFAANLATGLDFEHSLRRAMYASSMKISVKTAQAGMPYKDDLDEYISYKRNKNFTYNKELNLALEIIKEAYENISHNKKFKIYSKTNGKLVTDIDLEIEKYMIDKITKKFRNDNFITEEFFPNNQLDNRTWIINPIDGTNHFIKKDNFFGIQLAFNDKKQTQFAVIYLPIKNELYYAINNKGVYVNNNKIILGEDIPLNECIVEFSGSINKSYDIKKTCFENIIKNNKLASNILYINSSSIAYTNLISGISDALIISSDKPWNYLAGEFMCTELNFNIIYLDSKKKVKLITKNDKLKDIILPNKIDLNI